MRARSSIGQSIGLRIRGLGVRLPSGAPIRLHSAGTLSAPIHASLYVSAVRVGPPSGAAHNPSHCAGRVIWLIQGRTR